MPSLTGSLLLGLGGAFLVLALTLAIAEALDPYVSALFIYGALLGFLAFFLIGIGLSLILEARTST